MIKKCNACSKREGRLVEKPLSDFGRHSATASGLRGNCKECEQAASVQQRKDPIYVAREKQRYLDQRDQLLEYKKQYYRKYEEKFAELGKKRYEANPEPIKARAAARAKLYPEEVLHNVRMRQTAKINATPPWLTKEQRQKIKKLYKEARSLTNITGVKHEVDHIIPLRGKERHNGFIVEVRGWHVPWNLKVITRKENRKKSNKFVGAQNDHR